MDGASLKDVKHEEKRVEDIGRSSSSSLNATVIIDERRLLWKIDLRLIPWLSVLYLLSFIDKGSIGNAKLYHLEHDLRITDRNYLTALTVFFFPYAFFEPISNVFLRRLKPSVYLSTMMILWGVVMTCHGFITNYASLIAVRFLLGVTESGLYPGIIFYLSTWYSRSEIGTRVAVFFSAATVAGAFSGFLAAAIANLEGVGGKAAWQWIFILEGLATVVIAFASFWTIQDFPLTAKFLSEEERNFVIEKLKNDSQHSAGGEKFSMQHIYAAYKDWQTWIAMVMAMGSAGPIYAFSLFTPTIINQLGFHATAANLLTVPVYVWACLLTCAVGVFADRTRSRGYINIVFLGIGLVGYTVLIVSTKPSLSYFGVFLAASAIYPVAANTISWIACNVEGSYKRAVVLATVLGWGGFNGAVTVNVYRAKDAPRYRLGHGIILGFVAIGFLGSIAYHLFLKRENNKRAKGDRDEVINGIANPLAKEVNGVYGSIEEAKEKKGDKWSGFRYTL